MFGNATIRVPGKRLAVAPYAFLSVRMHDGNQGIHKLSAVADGQVIDEMEVAAPFVREHRSLGITVPLHERNECGFRAIRDALQQALPALTRDAAEYPVLAE